MNPVTQAKTHGIRSSLLLATLLMTSFAVVGCDDGVDRVRAIERERQTRVQKDTEVDHLGEVHSLLSRLVELNPQESQREILYHLNRWKQANNTVDAKVTPLISTVNAVRTEDELKAITEQPLFAAADIDHLRDCYLFRQISEWVDREPEEDTLLTALLNEQESKLSEEDAEAENSSPIL